MKEQKFLLRILVTKLTECLSTFFLEKPDLQCFCLHGWKLLAAQFQETFHIFLELGFSAHPLGMEFIRIRTYPEWRQGPSPIHLVARAFWEAEAASLPAVPGGLVWPWNMFSLIQISLHQVCVSSHDVEWTEASQLCQGQWEMLSYPFSQGQHPQTSPQVTLVRPMAAGKLDFNRLLCSGSNSYHTAFLVRRPISGPSVSACKLATYFLSSFLIMLWCSTKKVSPVILLPITLPRATASLAMWPAFQVISDNNFTKCFAPVKFGCPSLQLCI